MKSEPRTKLLRACIAAFLLLAIVGGAAAVNYFPNGGINVTQATASSGGGGDCPRSVPLSPNNPPPGTSTLKIPPGATVTFQASAVDPDLDCSGGTVWDPVSYVWSFGDGFGASGGIVTHQYPASGGPWTVMLRLHDDDLPLFADDPDVNLFCQIVLDPIKRVSVAGGNPGAEATNYSWGASLAVVDDTHQYVAFASSAPNLDGGTANAYSDIFVRDTCTNFTTLLSVNLLGEIGNGHSLNPAISADGQWVAFESDADNLACHWVTTPAPGHWSCNDDGNTASDIYLRGGGTNEALYRVSTPVGGGKYTPSPNASGSSHRPAISAVQGTAPNRYIYVVFESDATNLRGQPYEQYLVTDVFRVKVWLDANPPVHDAGAVAEVEKVSKTPAVPPSESRGESHWPAVDASGNYVAFQSIASDLVTTGPGDTNGTWDIFLRDLSATTPTTTLVSVPDPSMPDLVANGPSGRCAVSVNGSVTRVVFESDATNLCRDGAVPTQPDNNGRTDVFQRVVSSPVGTSLVSRNKATPWTFSNGPSFLGGISKDGSYCAFYSWATDLRTDGSDENNAPDVYVWDDVKQKTYLASLGPVGVQGYRRLCCPDSVTNLCTHLQWRCPTSDDDRVGAPSIYPSVAAGASHIWTAFASDAATFVPGCPAGCGAPSGDCNDKMDVFLQSHPKEW